MYNNLKSELLEARKARQMDRSALIVGIVDDIDKKVLVARKKAEAAGEEFIVPNAEVVAVLKNQVKNLTKGKQEILEKVGECEAYLDIEEKIAAISAFLPPRVAGDDLRLVIQSLGAANMGQAMKLLKEQATAQGYDYDGKEASVIAKEIFL